MIALKRVLVPYDFSETSAAAVTYAVGMARNFGAEVVFLYVADRTQAELDGELAVDADGQVSGSVRDAMLRSLGTGDVAAVSPRLYAHAGTPADVIVRFAREHEVDLIVMGTHGRGFVGHLLMGSVAEKVVRTAPCPVLTVRNPHAAESLEVVADAAEAARAAV